MVINSGGSNIKLVDVIDDKADARTIMAMNVDEANLEPILENGPLPPLPQFIEETLKKADAAICDFRLELGPYAMFNGAEAVAKFYERKWPAILCTTYGKADIDKMRPYRRMIPVLIRTDDINPDAIAAGLEYCIQEFSGNFSTSRKPWRTQVRVEEVDKDMNPPMFFVVLPGWSSTDKIRLPLDMIPEKVRAKVQPGLRFHAEVNKGTEDQDEIYITNCELV